MDSKQVELLKEFVNLLNHKPEVLHLPNLSFFKEWLISLGAKLPGTTASTSEPCVSDSDQEEMAPEPEESPESELEFDDESVIPGDTDPHQPMGDESIEVTEEMSDLSSEKRAEGQAAYGDGDYEKAVQCFTEAILNNPTIAMLYAKRASCYVKQQKPCAAIRDCDKAINMNPDSAPPYKWRGFANKLLGRWEAAYNDLQTSLKLDYSEDAYEAAKEVEPKHKRFLEHKRKYERRKEEKRQKEQLKRMQEKSNRKRQEAQKPFESGDDESNYAESDNLFANLLSDPEVLSAVKDPEVMNAFMEVSSNPAAMHKYANNPKVKKLFEKLSSMKGPTGMPGGMPFGMGSGFKPPQSSPDLD